jgi:CheY-like chemotaxis protein
MKIESDKIVITLASPLTFTFHMTQANLQPPQILLVEDDKINQMVAQLTIEKIGNYHIEIASDGQEAIDMTANKRYDLILMDINMPFLNGSIATQRIRQREQQTNTHLPIIGMTADTQACLEVGMDDVLDKPLVVDGLKKILNKWLNKD